MCTVNRGDADWWGMRAGYRTFRRCRVHRRQTIHMQMPTPMPIPNPDSSKNHPSPTPWSTVRHVPKGQRQTPHPNPPDP